MSEITVALREGMRRSALLMLMLCAVACSSSKRIATIKVDGASHASVSLEVTDYNGKKILDSSYGIGTRIPNGEAFYEIPAKGKACITGVAIQNSDDQRIGFVHVKIFMKDPAKRTSANTAEKYSEGEGVQIATACID